MDFKDLLNRDVRDLFGSRRDAAAAPAEARCAEASLVIRTREGGVDFVCLLDRALLFSLPGRLDGPLSVTPQQGADRVPVLRITVPLRLGASATTVTVEHRALPLDLPPAELEPSWVLAESVTRAGPQETVLDFAFERQHEEIRYHFVLPGEATAVRQAEKQRVRFRALPSVSQMAAFLKAAAGERGGGWRIPEPGKQEPVTWMRSILRQGGPERMDAVVEAWEKAGPREGPPFAPSATEALEAFLRAAGCTLPPGLVPALCLYVEIEMERITCETIGGWHGGTPPPLVSPYTIEAVAQAFDVPLLALSLSRGQVSSAGLRAGLCALSPFGLLLGHQRGGEALRFEHVTGREEAGDLAGLARTWTGDVLMCPPVMEHVSARDLALFLRSGRPVMGCFQSDLDRRRVWKRLLPGQAECPDFGFVDGFRVYHFQSSILGRVGEEGEEPSPRAGVERADVSLWRDDRDSLHFLPSDASEETAAPLERTTLPLYLPAVDHLPDMLPEMSEARRRGRVEGVAIEVQKLDLLAQALTSALARPDRYRNLGHHPDDLRLLRQSLSPEALRPLLGSVVDARTLDELLAMVAHDPPSLELMLYEPVARRLGRREVGDAVGVALVLEMCLSDAVKTRSGFKNFNRSRFRSELLDEWMKLAESRQPELRVAGSILLGTSAWLAERHERLVVTYALNHALEQADEDTARETAAALVRLALEETLPAPRLWELRVVSPAAPASKPAVNPQAVEAARVAEEMRQWMGRVGTTLFGVSSLPAAPPSPRGLASLLAAARLALSRLSDFEPARDGLVISTRQDLEAMLRALVSQWRTELEITSDEEQGASARASAECLVRCAGQWRGVLESGQVQVEGGTVEWRPWQGREVLEPAPFWVSEPRTGGYHRTSPFFLHLVDRAMAGGAESVRVVLWRPGAGLQGLQVLHAGQGRFVDFLELQEVLSASFLDDGEKAILRGLSCDLAPEEHDEAAQAREKAHAEAAVAFLDGIGDGRGVTELVTAFQLKESYAPHVARILEGVRTEWEGLRRLGGSQGEP